MKQMWPQGKEEITGLRRRMRGQGTNHQTSTLVYKISTLDPPTMVVKDQIKEKEEGFKPRVFYQTCRKAGHTANECWFRKEDNFELMPQNCQPRGVFLATNEGSSEPS